MSPWFLFRFIEQFQDKNKKYFPDEEILDFHEIDEFFRKLR